MGKRGEGSGWSQGRIKEAETPSFYSKSWSQGGPTHTPESWGVHPVSQFSSLEPDCSGWPSSPNPHLPSSTPLSLSSS